MGTKKKQSTSESPKGRSTSAPEPGKLADEITRKRQWDELQKLAALFVGELELAGKLKEALETDRFFITVTFQKKYKPDDEHDHHHYYIRKNFEINDVVPSMKKIASDFVAKENPTAEQPDKTTWR